MRILYAHSFYRAPGGEDRHVRDQVDLVSGAHDVELVSESNVDLSESPATATRMLYSRAKKRDVGRIIDRFAPDVVHIHNTYPSLGPAVVLAANDRGIPIVMTVHNFRLRCPNGLMFTEGALCRRCQSGVYTNALLHQCFPTMKQAERIRHGSLGPSLRHATRGENRAVHRAERLHAKPPAPVGDW